MKQHAFRAATLAASIALAFAAAASLAAGPAAPATLASPTPGGAALASGLEKSGMDPSVRPQDDLFRSMNGQWLKTTAIPADKSDWGTFTQLEDRSNEQVKALVEGLAAQPQKAGTNGQKIADDYRAFVDVTAIDQAGLAPAAPALKEVDNVADAGALVALLGRWEGLLSLPLDVSTLPDFDKPEIYAAVMGQGGLGLPDRDYYLKNDPRFAKARAAYVAYLGKLFELAGDAQSHAHAAAVMALETRLAQAQWDQVRLRDPKKAYNPKTPAQLAALAPGVDWNAFAAAASLPAGGTVVVMQPSYVAALAGLVKSQPLATWKLYLKAHRLDADALVLPAGFRDASFAFHGQAIEGLEQQRPRWQLAMDDLDAALGEAVGELYVARHFPPAAKARAQELVGNLMKAYSASIDGLTWMSPQTRQAAHEKLSKYTTKIGFPDRWRDYSKLEIVAGDAFGNDERAGAFEYHRKIVRVGQRVDRTEWGMTPQTVNAYYEPTTNEIVFPAAILQPPFFDASADDAVNYGAIGAIIGHEISHGFDDEGSQFDGDGRLRNWWTPADRKAFDAITGRLVAQYAGYEPLPGKHLNGKLTLGENIADLSGLQIAFKAYKLSLGGKPSPVIDGLTGEQRFYLGWAQAWRSKIRDERLLESIVRNPHAPDGFRAIGAAVNADGFHEAFGTKPGDGMWKAPADRIRLW
jgi:putative endopeptidase